MDKQTIQNFKDGITPLALIKQYSENGYGSVEIIIRAGEIIKITPRMEFLFEKDYTLIPKKA